MPALSLRKKLAFAALTTCALACLLELLARSVEWSRSWRHGEGRKAVCNELHPLRYDFAPGTSLPVNGATARINRAGLRGALPDAVKQRIRVLCLGDSCTFGYAPDVDDSATYPAALGRILDPARFEVLNGGRPGYGSLDVLDFFLYHGVELQPDVVVILAGWNEYLQAHPVVQRPPPADWPNSLALVRLGRELIRRVVRARPAPLAAERARVRRLPTPGDRLADEVFARTERITAELVRACRAHGATPILVTYANFTRDDWTGVESLTDGEFRPALPYLLSVELSPSAWRRYVVTTNDLIRRVAGRLNVPLVEGDAIRDIGLFSDLVHLKAEGCEALARRVAPVVLEVSEHRTQAGQ
jgi:lysophospholipase L1-like esterase